MDKRIAVVTITKAEETEGIMRALRAYGIERAEITFRTQCTEEAIAVACERFPDMEIGAGTVLGGEQCEKALAAGAKFIVSPGLSEEVAEICRKVDVPYYPGCVTPTEIMKALSLGLNIVKFFHADIYGGIEAMKALSAPFPQIKFIPTGGIGKANVGEYLAWDKIYAVGGSSFTKEALLAVGRGGEKH